MLIKVGTHRINLAHVCEIEDKGSGEVVAYFVNANAIGFAGNEADQFLAAWDGWAADQANLKESINRYNGMAEDFNAKIQEVAKYEQELLQREAMLNSQNKSGIITPGMMMPRKGRG